MTKYPTTPTRYTLSHLTLLQSIQTMELALILFSLFLLTSRAPSHAQQQLTAVLDTDGNQVVSAVQYRVLPAGPSNSGGLRLSRVNGTCPTHVALHSSPLRRGQPVMFFLDVNSVGSIIPELLGLYILVPRPSTCPQSTLWTVDEGYITTGGAVSTTDPLASRFALSKAAGEAGYRISVFCSTCIPCKILCPRVAPEEVNGRMLLSVSDCDDYLVVFERVKEPSIILPGTVSPQD